MRSGRKILIFDGTARAGEAPLRAAWRVGAHLYRQLGRVDSAFGASSWNEALAWIAATSAEGTVEELQYWGHGTWGKVHIASDALSIESMLPGHPHERGLQTLRNRLLPSGRALVWFRTCETFGARAGQTFAQNLSRLLHAKVAGHTHVIGALQSGLHGLHPNASPHWSPEEGIQTGTPEAPVQAHQSSRQAPNTLHFMNSKIPPNWFQSSEPNI
jgi:hypothetical protein